jgi:hypothetical protein
MPTIHHQEHAQLHLNYEQEHSSHDATQSHLQRESHTSGTGRDPKTLQDLHMAEVATHAETQGQYASILSDHTEMITTLNEAYSQVSPPDTSAARYSSSTRK